ncbi:MAG: hypothetical protein WC670_05250 [Pseudolabrys sp.]
MKGLLLVLVDPAPTLEEELNDWYDMEHLPERAVLTGFETAQRYASLGDGPRYAAIYDLTDLDALQSDAYLAVSGANFSPWTRRVTSRAHPVRLVARQTTSEGKITGPCSRLLMLKFCGSTSDDRPLIAAGLEASFASAPGHLKSRIFAGVEPEADFTLAIAEFAGSNVPPLAVGAFGPCSERIELAATYRPYRV